MRVFCVLFVLHTDPVSRRNNYSLFVGCCDGGRTTQKAASFDCFRGRHIAQEEEEEKGVTERETIARERRDH